MELIAPIDDVLFYYLCHGNYKHSLTNWNLLMNNLHFDFESLTDEFKYRTNPINWLPDSELRYYKIPDEEVKNQSVIFKEFEQEFPGILNWAIEGYRKYQSEGVEEPKVVLDAIKEYRSDSDTLGRFMEECCTASDSSVSTKDLFKAYESWCSSNSEYKQYKRQPSLTRKLGENGYQISFRGSRRSYLEGYKLIEEEENQIFEPEEEVEPVRESEFEEEDDF